MKKAKGPARDHAMMPSELINQITTEIHHNGNGKYLFPFSTPMEGFIELSIKSIPANQDRENDSGSVCSYKPPDSYTELSEVIFFHKRL